MLATMRPSDSMWVRSMLATIDHPTPDEDRSRRGQIEDELAHEWNRRKTARTGKKMRGDAPPPPSTVRWPLSAAAGWRAWGRVDLLWWRRWHLWSHPIATRELFVGLFLDSNNKLWRGDMQNSCPRNSSCPNCSLQVIFAGRDDSSHFKTVEVQREDKPDMPEQEIH
jgi:hypothetical protein